MDTYFCFSRSEFANKSDSQFVLDCIRCGQAANGFVVFNIIVVIVGRPYICDVNTFCKNVFTYIILLPMLY